MDDNNWLPHLTNEMTKGARRHLCAYLVSLEAWRRGLKIKWYSRKVKKRGIHAPGRLFSISSADRTHTFYKTQGDKVSAESQRVTGNKDLAKKLFAEFDVPFPEGKRFSAESNNYEIIEYAKEIGFPLVLKPTKGFQGIGVVANIMTEEYLNESLKYVREELGYMDVIVERFIRGKEYRLYVIENEVIAAINRVPANIIGDGNHTIRQLIKLKNKQRLKNPRLAVCLIKVDYEVKKYVEKAGLTLDSVLENGEILYLREKSNISTGGDSIDVLDELPATMKSTAVNSLKSIPVLPHGGVDLIYDDTNPDSQAYVLEINAIPQIGSLVYPMKGKGRDIPAALIDYYFPET